MTSTVVVIDGKSLSCATLVAVARQQAVVAVGEPAVAAARAAWLTGQELAAWQPVYGRNTGVGANHVVDLSERDRAEHGIRLLRSHAAGTGPLLRPIPRWTGRPGTGRLTATWPQRMACSPRWPRWRPRRRRGR